MVITGVADRVPERIAHVVYLDAFVPQDGQSMLDLIPPDRRPPMEALVQSEGQGWLLPRMRRTCAGHCRGCGRHRSPISRSRYAARTRRLRSCRAPPIRCTQWPNAVYDRHAEEARRTPGWQSRELATSHLPYITHPRELADLLHEVAA